MLHLLEIIKLNKICSLIDSEKDALEYYHKNAYLYPALNKKLGNIRYYVDKKTDAECIVVNEVHEENRLHIVFKGTDSKKDWKQNLEFIPIPIVQGREDLRVHKGFYEQYMGLKNLLEKELVTFHEQCSHKKQKEIIISGHSLGGALAMICGIFLCKPNTAKCLNNPVLKIVTIGSPRVICSNLCEWFNLYLKKSTTRIVNHKDSVPHYPPSGPLMQYQHPDSVLVYLKDGGIFEERKMRTFIEIFSNLLHKFNAHSLDIYIEEVSSFRLLRKVFF